MQGDKLARRLSRWFQRKTMWLKPHKKLYKYGFFQDDADRAKNEAWGTAFREYKDSSRIMDKYDERYDLYQSKKGKVTFLGILFAIMFAFEVILAVMLPCIIEKPVRQVIVLLVAVPILAAAVIALARWLYYYWMDFQLSLASNRIQALQATWLGIRRIANEAKEGELPPPPKRAKDVNYAPYDIGLAGYFKD